MKRMVVAFALALLAWGCDSGPKGPGEFAGLVESPGPLLGGVVLEVAGKGIEGFSGAGGSRVFWAPREGFPNSYRVMVIQPSALAEIQFRVSMRDLAEGRPRASIVNLVGGDNFTIPATPEYRVRFGR
jgi:hypothetical protein